MPGFSVQQVDLSTFEPGPKQWQSTLGLIHNLPKDSFTSIASGRYKPNGIAETKKKRDTDEYPIAFCEAFCLQLCDVMRKMKGSPEKGPKMGPVQQSLMMNILDSLNNEEMTLMLDELNDFLPVSSNTWV